MEKKLSGKELAKVFAMYFMQDCVMIKEDGAKFLYQIDTIVLDIVKRGFITYKIKATSLSKISDEDAIEVAKIYERASPLNATNDQLIKVGQRIARRSLTKSGDWHSLLQFSFVFQYFISKGYAVPLFFAPNHWANGQNAIELEIAIDATDFKTATI